MAPSLETYSSIRVEDLLQDEHFLQHFSRPTDATAAFWDKVIRQYPEQASVINHARQVLSGLKAYPSTTQAPAGAAERGWAKLEAIALQEGLFDQEGAIAKKAKVVSFFNKSWVKVAAAAVIIVGSFFTYSLFNKPVAPQIVSTTFGNQQTITLPDNSVVVLNGNSSIKFSKQWGKNEKREVWIEGEAFLQVKHLAKTNEAANDGERFVVHLKNMDVEVLGTSFNVRNRLNAEEVMLQEGSVQLTAEALEGVLKMEPGDVVSYDAVSGKMLRKKTETTTMNGWTNHQFHFDATPLTEIVSMLEETYGLKITIANPTLMSRSISGYVTATDEDVLLQAIEVMLGAKIARHNNQVTIQ